MKIWFPKPYFENVVFYGGRFKWLMIIQWEASMKQQQSMGTQTDKDQVPLRCSRPLELPSPSRQPSMATQTDKDQAPPYLLTSPARLTTVM